MIVIYVMVLSLHRCISENGKWQSISLSKQDKLFKDAMWTASYASLDEIAEELLSYFVDIGSALLLCSTYASISSPPICGRASMATLSQ